MSQTWKNDLIGCDDPKACKLKNKHVQPFYSQNSKKDILIQVYVLIVYHVV